MADNIEQKLQGEGFKHVYEWADKPGTEYPEHRHKGRVSFYVTKGSMTMWVEGKEYVFKEGDRFDVPIGVSHSAKVGSDGCTTVVGEDIKGDS